MESVCQNLEQAIMVTTVIATVVIWTTDAGSLLIVIVGPWWLVVAHLQLAGGLEVCWMLLVVRIVVFGVDH